jgi:hypothetical protein
MIASYSRRSASLRILALSRTALRPRCSMVSSFALNIECFCVGQREFFRRKQNLEFPLPPRGVLKRENNGDKRRKK